MCKCMTDIVINISTPEIRTSVCKNSFTFNEHTRILNTKHSHMFFSQWKNISAFNCSSKNIMTLFLKFLFFFTLVQIKSL